MIKRKMRLKKSQMAEYKSNKLMIIELSNYLTALAKGEKGSPASYAGQYNMFRRDLKELQSRQEELEQLGYKNYNLHVAVHNGDPQQ